MHIYPWFSPDQVQVVLSQMAGPETVLRAATHGLVLGALQEDGPLPGELEELRSRMQAGESLVSILWVAWSAVERMNISVLLRTTQRAHRLCTHPRS
jgi:hypothetical protein